MATCHIIIVNEISISPMKFWCKFWCVVWSVVPNIQNSIKYPDRGVRCEFAREKSILPGFVSFSNHEQHWVFWLKDVNHGGRNRIFNPDMWDSRRDGNSRWGRFLPVDFLACCVLKRVSISHIKPGYVKSYIKQYKVIGEKSNFSS